MTWEVGAAHKAVVPLPEVIEWEAGDTSVSWGTPQGYTLARIMALRDEIYQLTESANPMTYPEHTTAHAAVKTAEEKLSKAQAKRNKAQAKVTEAQAFLKAARVGLDQLTYPPEPLSMTHGRNNTPIPPVVMFVRKANGCDYTYAATGIPGRMTAPMAWFVTGQETRAFTWRNLLDWMGPEGRASLVRAGNWSVVK